MKLENIFVTTIERSKEHRLNNINRIGAFAQKYFNIQLGRAGVDGSALKNEEIIRLIKQGVIRPSKPNVTSIDEMIFMPGFSIQRYLSGSEIGIFLSHFNFWVHMLQKNIGCALIMEDDAFFEEEILYREIQHLLDTKIGEFHHVSFFKHPKQINTKPYLDYDEKYHRIDARSWGAVAYLITLDGVKKLLEKSCPIRFPLDYTLNMVMEQEKKGLLLKNPPVTLCDNKSFVIGGDPYSRAGNTMVNKAQAQTQVQAIPIKPVKQIPQINKFYMVSIERSKKHRGDSIADIKNKINELYGEEITFMGVDGRDLTISDIEKLMIEGIIMPSSNADITFQDKERLTYMPKFRRFIKAGEFGCFLSHISIWKDIVKNNIDYAVILEDDVLFEKEEFERNMKIIMENAPENFDTISIFKNKEQRNRKFLDYNDIFHSVDPETWGTVGYIISLKGAAEKLKHTAYPISFPVDYAISEHGFRTKNSYLYKTVFIDHIDEASIIDASNIYNINMKLDAVFVMGEKNDTLDTSIISDIPARYVPRRPQMANINFLLQNGLTIPQLVKDGKIWSENEKRHMTDDEIIFFLNNVEIWQTILHERKECALVIDSSMKPCQGINIKENIETLIENRPPLLDLILLSRNSEDSLLKCNEFFYYAQNPKFGMKAYIITYKGVERIMEFFKPLRTPLEMYVLSMVSLNKTGYMAKTPLFEK
jgi:GR25 family glycosyltransferase involved in LPS biosynthesis